MAKPNRTHAPGCIVHITARTQGSVPWFTESLRPRVVSEIVNAANASGHVLLAFVIMPNHFHIIVEQCPRPLSNMMHRVMHRSAALLRWSHKLEGHVFARRYWSGVCTDATYVRATIAYVHLNPWRAKLCHDPAAYEWSSLGDYLESAKVPGEKLVNASAALSFFQSDDDPCSGLSNHIAYLNYQIAVDRFLAGELPARQLLAPQPCIAGDEHWSARYAAAAAAFQPPTPRVPLYDAARAFLTRLDPRCPLDLVRSGTHARAIVIIRRNLIAALLAYGYRGHALARFFGVTETVVSRVAVSLNA